MGRCVGQLFCGRLEDWLVRFLVGLSVGRSFGQPVVRLVGRSCGCVLCMVGRSASLSLGRWMDWLNG